MLSPDIIQQNFILKFPKELLLWFSIFGMQTSQYCNDWRAVCTWSVDQLLLFWEIVFRTHLSCEKHLIQKPGRMVLCEKGLLYFNPSLESRVRADTLILFSKPSYYFNLSVRQSHLWHRHNISLSFFFFFLMLLSYFDILEWKLCGKENKALLWLCIRKNDMKQKAFLLKFAQTCYQQLLLWISSA